MPCDREEIEAFERLPKEEVIAEPPEPPLPGEPPTMFNIAWTLRPDARWAASLSDEEHEEQHDKTAVATEWALYKLAENDAFGKGVLAESDEMWVQRMANIVFDSVQIAKRRGDAPPRFGTILTRKQQRVAQRSPDGSNRLPRYAKLLEEIARREFRARGQQDDQETRLMALHEQQVRLWQLRVQRRIQTGELPPDKPREPVKVDWLAPAPVEAEAEVQSSSPIRRQVGRYVGRP